MMNKVGFLGFIFSLVICFIGLSSTIAAYCPSENPPCQAGFTQEALKENMFICRSPMDSPWRGSYYTVYNVSTSTLRVSSRYTMGNFKNEIDITAIKVRVCVSPGNYIDTYACNPAGLCNFQTDMETSGKYMDYILTLKNGTVQVSEGEIATYWPGPQSQPTINLGISELIV